MQEAHKTIGRRTFLTKLGAVLLPAVAVLAAGNSAEAKKMTVLGKSAWAGKTPTKKSTTVRHAVHTAHAFGKSSR